MYAESKIVFCTGCHPTFFCGDDEKLVRIFHFPIVHNDKIIEAFYSLKKKKKRTYKLLCVFSHQNVEQLAEHSKWG